jgi:hypothetical protein
MLSRVLLYGVADLNPNIVRSFFNLQMIKHFDDNHGPSAGVKCKNCAARFLFDDHLDMHVVHCNA